MRRSQLYRQTARHHGFWLACLLLVAVNAACETYVAFVQHDGWMLAVFLLVLAGSLAVGFDNARLFRHFRHLARRAAADEWRYAHRPAIAYRNHRRPTHKHQHN